MYLCLHFPVADHLPGTATPGEGVGKIPYFILQNAGVHVWIGVSASARDKKNNENGKRKYTMNNRPKKPVQRTSGWGTYIGLFLLMFILFSLFSNRPSVPTLKISYSEFRQDVLDGKISKITLRGDQIRGTYKTPVEKKEDNQSVTYRQFDTVIPGIAGSNLLDLLEKKGVNITAESDQRSWFSTLLIGFLPWLLIIGFFVYSSSKLKGMGGGGGLFSFAKSKAKRFTKTNSDITFKDVAGLTNAKKELEEIIDFLKEPQRFGEIGGKLPRGVLLAGPPGIGKTLMAKAVAGEANVPFYSISGSEFIEMFVGVGASRVRDMFLNAKKDAPAIIFIDEIDSIGRVRGTGLGGGHDEREQTLNQILSEMDGFAPHESVVVIAATNRPDILDPALVRPGRFDRRITLDLPQKKARQEILNIHARHVPLTDDVDFEKMAEMTVGFSGADLQNLVNEAALLAARKRKTQVGLEEFQQARDKIIMGLEREEVLNENEKRAVAYHEAGHALLAKLLPGVDPLQKVTILPRGQSLGATEQIPEEDRHNFSQSYLLNRLAIMLGGRVAEKLVFKEITTGAGDDLKKATQMARRMVCQWGMSEKLGAATFRQGEEHPFLGREITEPREFSEHTAQQIDEEVQRIIREMEKKAEEVLGKNIDKLDKLAAALLQHETLDNAEVDEALAAGTTNPLPETHGAGKKNETPVLEETG